MTQILLLSLQTVLVSLEADEDFAPPSISFFQADGVTPISFDGISLSAQIGSFPALTNATNGGITVSGNSLTFFVAAAQKSWATGRYPFTLTAVGNDTTGTLRTVDVFANSYVTVGQPASFSITPYSSGGAGVALANMSGAEFLAAASVMTTAQQATLFAILADAQAATFPNLDFSHVVNSQYIGSTPFLFTF